MTNWSDLYRMQGPHVNWCPTCGRTDSHPDMQAPAPISGEAGAVSAIADHSIGLAPEEQGSPTIATPSVEADGAAASLYRARCAYPPEHDEPESRCSWAVNEHPEPAGHAFRLPEEQRKPDHPVTNDCLNEGCPECEP